MSGPRARLQHLSQHLHPHNAVSEPCPRYDFHSLSPTLFLPRAAEIEPEALAIHHVSSNERIIQRSYKEFSSRALGVAYYIRQKNYKRVAILCPNTPAFLEAIFGIAAAGAVNVAVNYRLNALDIAYILDHAEVDAIVADQEYIHLLENFSQTHPNVALIVDSDTGACDDGWNLAISSGQDHDQQTGARGWNGLITCVADERDTIAIAYTSGTTARPKGVEFTHRGVYLAALANLVESGLNYNNHNQRAKYLWTLPMFHAMGWTFPWAVTAVRGTHYCLRKIDYSLIWRFLQEEAITHYNAAPTVNTLLCASPDARRLSQPVRVTVAASPPTPQLLQRMQELNLQPVHVYGLTETYGPITRGYQLPQWDQLLNAERLEKMARQGHGFLTSLPIRVVKFSNDGIMADVAKNGTEVGEIVCTGNICAKGYYKDPIATKKLFANGVLHTGDLAVWHPDGSAQITDREKDVIISGGENISSVALEAVLATHPGILEVAVVAVTDEHWGERPKAYITAREGVHGPLGAEVLQWAKSNAALSRFSLPKEVEVVNDLPKTSTGKIRKNVLREWAIGTRPG